MMSYIMRMLILALICPGFAYAQPTSEALSTVKTLLEAVRTGEAITVVNLTHPKVHELAGGRENALALNRNVSIREGCWPQTRQSGHWKTFSART